MANAFNLNSSSPAAGLGTFSYTVTTTGLYTLEFKSFLPYQPSVSAPQTTNPSGEVTDVTFAADSSGSRNNTYFTFNAASDAYGYYVWFNINGAGVDPAVAGRTGIQVAGATDATAATLATAAIAAINASSAASYVRATAGASGHAILTNQQPGGATNAANGAGGASAGASFSVTNNGTFGVPPVSGLVAKIVNNGSTVATYAYPSPTQPILGGGNSFQATAGTDVSLVLSSLSDADAALNAVKSIINFYQGS